MMLTLSNAVDHDHDIVGHALSAAHDDDDDGDNDKDLYLHLPKKTEREFEQISASLKLGFVFECIGQIAGRNSVIVLSANRD